MASLSDIKERIASTTSTRKITQSLELVAASKMKGFVRKALASRRYADNLLSILTHMETELRELSFGEERETGKTVFILTTSDKGLCGSLNQKLIRFLFTHPKWAGKASAEKVLITIGKKGSEAARRSGIQVHKAYEGIGENLSPLQILSMIEEIVSLWEDGTAKEVILVSPTYISPFIQHIDTHTYLPLRASTSKNRDTDELLDSTIEPDTETVAEEVGFQIVFSLFMRSFYELKASEYSSRMVAMKKASDSALEMISSLTLEYNKARQAKITAQVSELATAGEAMEDEEELITNQLEHVTSN